MNLLENSGFEQLDSYEAIRAFRDDAMQDVVNSHVKLNEFHELLMLRVTKIALEKTKSEWGEPPTHFAFFLMGSAARREQSVWSDQDHGIIYEQASEEAKEYFLKLGQELTVGFEIVGYTLCDGKVMASNPFWCKSSKEWEEQLKQWMEKSSWTTLRHLITFFDSRVLVGDEQLLEYLKTIIFHEIATSPVLLQRLMDNVGRVKKVIGVFGQLLVETKGIHTGKIHLKNYAFFPYVNSIRLLAMKGNISEPSTLSRLQKLPKQIRLNYESDFQKLLDYRVRMQANQKNYEDVHYLDVQALSSKEKKELKSIIKNGYKLHQETKKWIEKGCSSW